MLSLSACGDSLIVVLRSPETARDVPTLQETGRVPSGGAEPGGLWRWWVA